MKLTYRELWTALHGMVFGAIFLLSFAGVFIQLSGLRDDWVTEEGARRAQRRLIVGAWGMAIFAWIAVIVGTYMVYPWYRAKPPVNSIGFTLSDYPKALLVSNPKTAEWHEFGMEWKEHIGWFVPILATTVAMIVTGYRRQLAHDAQIRRAALILCSLAFFCACVAGFGAFINKAAPTH